MLRGSSPAVLAAVRSDPGNQRIHIFSYLGLLAVAIAQTTQLSSGRYLFAIAAVVALLNLSIRFVRRDRLPSLAAAWEVGFILIIASEGYFNVEALLGRFGADTYRLAASYLVGGFAAFMVGHALVFRRAVPLVRTWLEEHTVLSSRGRAFVLALAGAFVVVVMPGAIALATQGRWGVSSDAAVVRDGLGAAVGGLGQGAAMVLPAMIAYQLLVLRRSPYVLPYALSAPILLMNFVAGTRFVFLISLVGLVAVHVTVRPPSRTETLRLASVAVVALLAVSVMSQFRGAGIASAEPEAIAEAALADAAAFGDEGVVRVTNRLVTYFTAEPHHMGSSILGITYFWVPRQVWPDKPTLLGYWFARVDGTEGFAPGHSISAGFGGDAYVDFGFWGGLAALFVVGAAFGRLDRSASQVVAARTTPWIVLVGPLFGFAAFAVRSPLTSIISATGSLVWVVLYVKVLEPHRSGDEKPSPAAG